MKYRRKVTEVEAWFWDRDNFPEDTPMWVLNSTLLGPQPGWITLKTKSGLVHANESCWVVRELDGTGAYPCATEVFEATYEEVKNEAGS